MVEAAGVQQEAEDTGVLLRLSSARVEMQEQL